MMTFLHEIIQQVQCGTTFQRTSGIRNQSLRELCMDEIAAVLDAFIKKTIHGLNVVCQLEPFWMQ